MTATHEAWVDRWKGILIFLVVLGHVVGGGYHLADAMTQPVLGLIYKIIYFFHMPAFFLVAGYTFHEMAWRPYLTGKFRSLVVPYFVFGLVSMVIYTFAAEMVKVAFSVHATTDRYDEQLTASIVNWWYPLVSLLHGGGWPNGEGFRCNSVLWFLPCMFCTMVLFRTIVRLGGVIMTAIAFLGLGLDLSNVVPSGLPWGISKIAGYLPYVILGYGFAHVAWTHRDVSNKYLASAILLTMAFIYGVFAFFVPDPFVMRASLQGRIAIYAFGFIGSFVSAFSAKAMTCQYWAILGGRIAWDYALAQVLRVGCGIANANCAPAAFRERYIGYCWVNRAFVCRNGILSRPCHSDS